MVSPGQLEQSGGGRAVGQSLKCYEVVAVGVSLAVFQVAVEIPPFDGRPVGTLIGREVNQ